MIPSSLQPLLFAFIGLFVLSAAIMDWNWFFMNRRARIPIKVLGRFGARIMYGVMGFTFMLVGLFGTVVTHMK